MVVSLLYWGGQRVWGYDIVLGCRQHTVYTVPGQYTYSTVRYNTGTQSFTTHGYHRLHHQLWRYRERLV